MSVNLFNLASQLEEHFRNSDEYISLKRQFNEVNADPYAKQLLKTFHHLQLELQNKQMTGQTIREQEVETFENTLAIMQQNEKITRLLEADQRANLLIMEFNKRIAKPLEDLYKHLER